MRFEFATAGRIVFGAGTLGEIGPVAAFYGRRALVVTGRHPARGAALLEHLERAGVAAVTFSIKTEPSLEDIEHGVTAARDANCTVVIGCGGGAALDAAKAIAALLTNDGPLLDYLEVIGHSKPLTRAPAPCIAIPTTAGTGSEVTRNAVLASAVHRV